MEKKKKTERKNKIRKMRTLWRRRRRQRERIK